VLYSIVNPYNLHLFGGGGERGGEEGGGGGTYKKKWMGK